MLLKNSLNNELPKRITILCSIIIKLLISEYSSCGWIDFHIFILIKGSQRRRTPKSNPGILNLLSLINPSIKIVYRRLNCRSILRVLLSAGMAQWLRRLARKSARDLASSVGCVFETHSWHNSLDLLEKDVKIGCGSSLTSSVLLPGTYSGAGLALTQQTAHFPGDCHLKIIRH